MSNHAHIRPGQEMTEEQFRAAAAEAAVPEGAQPLYNPVPVPAMVYLNDDLATDPAGNAYVVAIINTPSVTQMPILLSQAQARAIGAKLQELGSKKAIQIAQVMPEGLILPGQG